MLNENKPYKGLLDNWDAIRRSGPNEEHLGFFIIGQFQGHPQFDMRTGWTSMIVKVDDENGMVETLNSRYKLGKPENPYKHYYGVNKPID